MTRAECIERYFLGLKQAKDAGKEVLYMRRAAETNLFLFLVFILGKSFCNNDWAFERCGEVEQQPDSCLDLWGREHLKSTIITFALTMQDILKNPEITIGIFSHTRPIAKGFLRQIKQEFEQNDVLKALYTDILYADPKKDAPKWSEDDGIVPVKRKNNPKEATVEAWGLVDGQPTSKHYQLIIYDDIVTLESVTTPEQMKKVTDAWRMSRNLGCDGGRTRYVGTRFHFNDTYSEIMKIGTVEPRIHPSTSDGTVTGDPVFFSREYLEDKKREMGSYVFSCQHLLNPVEDDAQGFKRDWLRYYKTCDFEHMNRYILCDPANEKKKSNDYTVFAVIGLSADNNYYLIDMIRDRLNLTERCDMLFYLHGKYRPIRVGYEKYGMQADVQHYQYVMKAKNYRFDVVELAGNQPKNDRIRKLVPVFEQGRFYMPEKLYKVGTDHRKRDLIADFIMEEYMAFPVGVHDDMLDCISRIFHDDLGTVFPMIQARKGGYYRRVQQEAMAAA